MFDALTHRDVPWPHLRASTHAGDAVPSPFSAVGLHPARASDKWREEVDLVEAQLRTGDFCALGEIGLDRRVGLPALDHQLHAFDAQLKLAAQFGLPVVMHAVRATALALERLARARVRVIWHAFAGPPELVERSAKLDMMFSVGRMVLNPNAMRCRRAVAHIPDELLLVESDLEAHEAADPSRLTDVLNEVASLRNTTRQRIAALTGQNASLTLVEAVRAKEV